MHLNPKLLQLSGWLRNIRKQKNFVFCDLDTCKGIRDIQLVVPRELFPKYPFLTSRTASLHSSVKVNGLLNAKDNQTEIQVQNMSLINAAEVFLTKIRNFQSKRKNRLCNYCESICIFVQELNFSDQC